MAVSSNPDGYYWLISYRNTLAYFDQGTGLVCHGNRESVPRNLLLHLESPRARLVVLSSDMNDCRHVALIGNQGEVILSATPSTRPLTTFALDSGKLALLSGCSFLSADGDGRIRPDRAWCNDWEEYTLEPLSQESHTGFRFAEPSSTPPSRAPISGFVVTYNRAHLVETCLQSIRFVDQLIVVDKSSTDGTVEIARQYADKLLVAPWTASADDTREFALSQCTHDLIVYLDDDECLSPASINFILNEATYRNADVYSLPFRSYYLGSFIKNRRDWPEFHERVFWRGSLAFSNKIHSNTAVLSTNIMRVPAGSDAFVYHFSYQDVAEWLDKVNRYTSQPIRASWFAEDSLPSKDFIEDRINYWLAGAGNPPDQSGAAYAMLRLIYDFADALKRWENENSRTTVSNLCQELRSAYNQLSAGKKKP